MHSGRYRVLHFVRAGDSGDSLICVMVSVSVMTQASTPITQYTFGRAAPSLVGVGLEALANDVSYTVILSQ